MSIFKKTIQPTAINRLILERTSQLQMERARVTIDSDPTIERGKFTLVTVIASQMPEHLQSDLREATKWVDEKLTKAQEGLRGLGEEKTKEEVAEMALEQLLEKRDEMGK